MKKQASYTLQEFAAREGIDCEKFTRTFRKPDAPKPVTDLKNSSRRNIYKLSDLIAWKAKNENTSPTSTAIRSAPRSTN